MITLDFIGLFIFLAGFVIGLGAVTVIDIHGFLGRKSAYWTEATTRTHKVTKPLIWIGIILAIIGGAILYRHQSFTGVPFMHAIIAVILILNGIFLSFKVSPFLLQQEKEGKAGTLLPKSLQRKIVVSLIVSDLGWWGGLLLFVFYLVNQN
ncbi:hypothetical protein IPG41_00255 [Candidatus Peregrinibacteria bacterium]|nr:MAG: hypothetical protein IPG41_00255 [Candidatus Peregrinibacteria bacterium]